MNYRDDELTEQLNQCVDLLNTLLAQNLLGVYLYGSIVIGGLQKYSDIDILVVTERATTVKEKRELIKSLLQISGIYMKSSKSPIELTIVVKSEVNPWRYPPNFDFQYGEWLREKFDSGCIEPWPTKVMPDLALLITQVLLASEPLFGPSPDQLLCPVPYRDFIFATTDALKHLMADIETDTRNVLLTYARIWSTLETDTIRAKSAAALFVLDRLPPEYQPVLERARAICVGEASEYWGDVQNSIRPCAEFMSNQIDTLILSIDSAGYANRSISLDITT